VLPLTTKM